MANHHPTPELLVAFSAGSLPLSHALCVATHLERCHDCRTRLHGLDNLGAQLLEELPPAHNPASLKDRVFAQLDTLAPVTAPDSAPLTDVPRCLQQYITGSYDSLAWHTVAPSIKTASLCVDSNGAKVEMLRIKPGGKAATHTHTGDEYTVILKGSFSDETGVYAEGDFIVRNGSHKHKPVATKNTECICLTVTDAPIKFTGFFSRLLNPFVRSSYRPI